MGTVGRRNLGYCRGLPKIEEEKNAVRFQDIQQYPKAKYAIDVILSDTERIITRWEEEYGLELCPEFQRGHVWTEQQRERYLEFLLRGGQSGPILFNHPGWMTSFKGSLVLVDGLQRLTAVLKFLRNETQAFGYLLNEYGDGIPIDVTLRFEVNNLRTHGEVLQWYVDLNSGGTVHTPEEIERVRHMIREA
jgi:hypothetical protein